MKSLKYIILLIILILGISGCGDLIAINPGEPDVKCQHLNCSQKDKMNFPGI